MSHVSKIVSLAATLLLFAGGVSLAGPPDPTKPTTQPSRPIAPQGVAPFWFLLPTENAQIPAKTGFIVKLKATYPPVGIFLYWEQKVNTSWQPYSVPTGAGWRTPSELDIPVAEDFFLQPGNYRVRATWILEHSDWRHFQIIQVRITPVPVPLKKLYPKPKIGPPPVEQQNVPQR